MGMHLHQVKRIQELIQICKAYEGCFYLNELLDTLRRSKRSPEEIQPIADKLIALIDSINLLNYNKNNSDEGVQLIAFEQFENIINNYKELVEASAKDGFLYHAREILLALAGSLITLVMGIAGGLSGMTLGAYDSVTNNKAPTKMFTGGATGVLVEGVLGSRTPTTLLIDKENQMIEYCLLSLRNTFLSLKDSITVDYREEIKKEILNDVFKGDALKFSDFCTEQQEYQALAFHASFLSPYLKGDRKPLFDKNKSW